MAAVKMGTVMFCVTILHLSVEDGYL
jgi:hypothetical protein